MKTEGLAIIYALIITVLLAIINAMITNLLNFDAYGILFGEIIFMLAMIWYYIATKQQRK
ncbi:hypothetical protein LCGC14_1903900 [marine sediment metagenome]|uniref:Uncharacterized protein n=1 Tax=marine sediment metagenome TaxID=412755 RepID=A0A0F9FW14_9ZZZZ